jgi:Holliday junction resolvase RusA-like endonuclease
MIKELVYPYKIDMSINRQYYNNPVQRGRKALTEEARNMRARIINDTLAQIGERKEFWRCDILEIELIFIENWNTQAGEIRKKDLDNRLKFLIDSIVKAYDIDDSQFFKVTAQKVQSEHLEQTYITIKKHEVRNADN